MIQVNGHPGYLNPTKAIFGIFLVACIFSLFGLHKVVFDSTLGMEFLCLSGAGRHGYRCRCGHDSASLPFRLGWGRKPPLANIMLHLVSLKISNKFSAVKLPYHLGKMMSFMYILS